MNIGLDIDGCMNNLQKSIAKVLKRDYNVEAPQDKWGMLKYAGITTRKDELEFWGKYKYELLDSTSIEKDAYDVIKELYEGGHRLDIITAREYNVAKLTIEWLKKHEISYHNIYFSCYDKDDVCKWKNIHIMVEDNRDNALHVAETGTIVLLYDRLYNKNTEHKNIIRCKNWKDVSQQIKKEITLNEKN